MRQFTQFIPFAGELVAAARRETLFGYSPDMAARNKSDTAYDPVTAADLAAEKAMRRLIEERFPEHGISGEELPDRPSQGGFVWSLDPIDGTRSYICGLPTWVTLIGLLDEGRPIMGAIDVPRLNEVYMGCEDRSVLRTGIGEFVLKVSDCATIADARFATTDPFLFQGQEAEKFERVRSNVRVSRFGHDGYAYAKLAAGEIDLVVETGLKTYDYNALIPVIRGAGGVFGDWQGGEAYEGGRVIAAATQDLFDEAVALLRD